MEERSGEVSQLLESIRGGNRGDEPRLFALVYNDLRRMAALQLRKERQDHTLQPTALVNELYLRLFDDGAFPATNRAHFLALSAQVMRRVLVDHARGKGAAKRGAAPQRIPLDDLLLYQPGRSNELLAVNDALSRLEQWAPRQSKIVEMRFFGGLSEEEIAEVLQISSRTVKRDWAMARAWLHAELSA
jgi:RNA polymerase sigma factor (TIGR02999 family)